MAAAVSGWRAGGGDGRVPRAVAALKKSFIKTWPLIGVAAPSL